MDEIVCLVEVKVTVGERSQTLYWSDASIPPLPPGDPERPNQAYDPRLLDANIERRFDLRTLAGLTGNAVLTVSNADGALDDFEQADWGACTVYYGDASSGNRSRNDEALFTGQVFDVHFTRTSTKPGTLRLTVRDARQKLQEPLQKNTYAGTNTQDTTGYEGTEDGLAGQPRPIALGRLRQAHVPAVWVNSRGLVAQVHDGPMSGITAIYNGGGPAGLSALSPLTGTAFDQAKPGPAEYVEDLQRGLVKLGARLAGRVTFDLVGAADPDYQDRPEKLLARLLPEGSNLDTSSSGVFLFLTVGWWGQKAIAKARVVDLFARSSGGFVFVDRKGQWKLRAFRFTWRGQVLALSDADIIAQETLTPPNLPGSLSVRWGKNYSVMKDSDLAGDVRGTDEAETLAQEWRESVVDVSGRAGPHHFFETALRTRWRVRRLPWSLARFFGPRADGTPKKLTRIVTQMSPHTINVDLGDWVDIAIGDQKHRGMITALLPLTPKRNLITLEVWG